MTPAESELLERAATAGVRVLDLRDVPRDVLYPAREHCVVRDGDVLSLRPASMLAGDQSFGAWGYFRTRRNGKLVFAETPPLRGSRHGFGAWEAKPCTVIHTTAAVMHAARFVGVPVQHGIAKDGTIVLCHSIRSYCHHADGANQYADGIEISGRGTINAAQIVAVQILLRYLDAEKRAHGCERLYVVPHAFSQKLKPNDCGAAVWPHTGQWAQDVLGWGLGPRLRAGVQPSWAPGTPQRVGTL